MPSFTILRFAILNSCFVFFSFHSLFVVFILFFLFNCEMPTQPGVRRNDRVHTNTQMAKPTNQPCGLFHTGAVTRIHLESSQSSEKNGERNHCTLSFLFYGQEEGRMHLVDKEWKMLTSTWKKRGGKMRLWMDKGGGNKQTEKNTQETFRCVKRKKPKENEYVCRETCKTKKEIPHARRDNLFSLKQKIKK